jgi:hypothetical protein
MQIEQQANQSTRLPVRQWRGAFCAHAPRIEAQPLGRRTVKSERRAAVSWCLRACLKKTIETRYGRFGVPPLGGFCAAPPKGGTPNRVFKQALRPIPRSCSLKAALRYCRCGSSRSGTGLMRQGRDGRILTLPPGVSPSLRQRSAGRGLGRGAQTRSQTRAVAASWRDSLLSPTLSSKGGEGDRAVGWWQCQVAPDGPSPILWSRFIASTLIN